MRTTVTLADDVVAAVERLRRSQGIGMSEAINHLVRVALAKPESAPEYSHKSYDLGMRIDVTNIGAVMGMLDELD